MAPLTNGDADLMIGSRTMGNADRGALSLPQRVGNGLASFLLFRLWQQPCTDLGPFTLDGQCGTNSMIHDHHREVRRLAD
jgi:hypothetical protein